MPSKDASRRFARSCEEGKDVSAGVDEVDAIADDASGSGGGGISRTSSSRNLELLAIGFPSIWIPKPTCRRLRCRCFHCLRSFGGIRSSSSVFRAWSGGGSGSGRGVGWRSKEEVDVRDDERCIRGGATHVDRGVVDRSVERSTTSLS